jgi:hypothetical protein
MSDTSLLDLTVREIAAELPNLSTESLVALRAAEAAGKTRITVVKAIDEELAAREGSVTLDVPEPKPEDFVDPPAAEGDGPGLPPHVSEPPPVLPEGEAVKLAVAELQILGADYTGELCEIRVGKLKFTGRGETREAAYRSAVGAWLASEGKALA